VKEIEEALLDRRIDLAVHSIKDVPTEFQKAFTSPSLRKGRTLGTFLSQGMGGD